MFRTAFQRAQSVFQASRMVSNTARASTQAYGRATAGAVAAGGVALGLGLWSTVDCADTSLSLNRAFVFIKPHAVTPACEALVKEKLAKSGISVKSEGSIGYKKIDEDKLIDTHYGAIASKAMDTNPKDLNVSDKAKAEFKKAFGMSWDEALQMGMVMNAATACKNMKINGSQLDNKWSKLTRGKNLIKFGGGFYCGQVDGVFVINGFYMSMRAKFCEDPASIKYFLVEWNPSKLKWEDFRGKVLGGTDPATAEAGSARRMILEQWKDLGLAEKPNVGDNGVHASASPFEAMAERVNWVGVAVEEDPFGAALIKAGIPKDTIMSWTTDPTVTFNGQKGSFFDFLEDTDSQECFDKAKQIYAQNK